MTIVTTCWAKSFRRILDFALILSNIEDAIIIKNSLIFNYLAAFFIFKQRGRDKNKK